MPDHADAHALPPRATPHRFPVRLAGRSTIVWVSLAVSMTVATLALTLMNGPVRPDADLSAAGIEAPSGSWQDRLLTFAPGTGKAAFDGIVVHHSGVTSGSAASIRKAHAERGIRNLGYHFVIGNGHGAHDGEIQVGARWVRQQPGAHVVGPRARALNQTTIGICLVGDGDRRPVTHEQFASLIQLVRTLQEAYGIDGDRVVLHRDVAPTASPGRLFPEVEFEQSLREIREPTG